MVATSTLEGMLIRGVQRGMLGENDYQALDKIFRFVSEYIDWSTEYEQTLPAKRVYMRFCEIL